MADFFDLAALDRAGSGLIAAIRQAYEAERPIPERSAAPAAIPAEGCGLAGLPALWQEIVAQSAHMACPWMSGHMDTAPHPAAALTQALVASLNNNLLFRELSPYASQIEEQLIAFFIARLELTQEWQGLFASGGSLANLTALFAAMGGYEAPEGREKYHLLMPQSGHLSLSKSALILGVSTDRIHKIACDSAGRMQLAALREALEALPGQARPIVASVLGTTIHGSVDDIAGISALCGRYGAWHHVDAIHGAALALSIRHRGFLAGLDDADSIALGPQKWMYVPRVSALTLIKGRARFESGLGTALPYSLGAAEHRGRWGLQGSRPADAMVLWAVLQAVGTRPLGEVVDHSIDLTHAFHARLAASDLLEPSHRPDLNLQVFRVGAADPDGQRLGAVQHRLAQAGRTWVSVSRYGPEAFLRAVLLSPALTTDHLDQFIADIEAAAGAS